jgi:hypothetical protein
MSCPTIQRVGPRRAARTPTFVHVEDGGALRGPAAYPRYWSTVEERCDESMMMMMMMIELTEVGSYSSSTARTRATRPTAAPWQEFDYMQI